MNSDFHLNEEDWKVGSNWVQTFCISKVHVVDSRWSSQWVCNFATVRGFPQFRFQNDDLESTISLASQKLSRKSVSSDKNWIGWIGIMSAHLNSYGCRRTMYFRNCVIRPNISSHVATIPLYKNKCNLAVVLVRFCFIWVKSYYIGHSTIETPYFYECIVCNRLNCIRPWNFVSRSRCSSIKLSTTVDQWDSLTRIEREGNNSDFACGVQGILRVAGNILSYRQTIMKSTEKNVIGSNWSTLVDTFSSSSRRARQ